MKLTVSDPSKTEALLKRMFMLAYTACGSTTGMGFLQARNNATEEQVWENVKTRGDYGGKSSSVIGFIIEGIAYGDYVFGRMMKLRVKHAAGGETIEIDDQAPRIDYQAWCGKYPTYLSLAEAAAKEVGVTLKGVV